MALMVKLGIVPTCVGPLEGGSSSSLLAPPRGSRARSILGGVLGTRDPHRILFVTTCYRPDSGGGHAGEWNTVPQQAVHRPLTGKRYRRRGSGRTWSASARISRTFLRERSSPSNIRTFW